MDDLIARIRADIEDDERVALAAIEVNDGVGTWGGLEGEVVDVMGPMHVHTNRHDPDAVLTRAKWEHGLLATLAEFVNSDNPSARVLARSAVSMLAKARGIGGA